MCFYTHTVLSHCFWGYSILRRKWGEKRKGGVEARSSLKSIPTQAHLSSYDSHYLCQKLESQHGWGWKAFLVPHISSRDTTQSRMSSTTSKWLLEISKEQPSTIPWSLCQCSIITFQYPMPCLSYMNRSMPLSSQGSVWTPDPLKTKMLKTERIRPHVNLAYRAHNFITRTQFQS